MGRYDENTLYECLLRKENFAKDLLIIHLIAKRQLHKEREREMFKFKSTMIIKLIGVIISYKKCKTEFKNSCMRRAMGDSSNQFIVR